MALNSRKVRLPELLIFRKFSLALRQEFARAEDILLALEESLEQVKALTEDGASRLRPTLRPSGPKESASPAQDRTYREHHVEDDSPESFLKEAVIHSSFSRSSDPAESRSSPDATVAMQPPSLDDQVHHQVKQRKVVRPPSGEPGSLAGDAVPQAVRLPGKGADPIPKAERLAEKRRSRKAAAESKAAKKKKETEADSSPETSSAPAPEKGEAMPPAKTSRSRKKSQDRQPAQSRSVPQQRSEEGAGGDVEREFWGDERSWAKGRRGKGEKDRSGRVGIVRVGAEGRPVDDAEPSPGEGE